MIEKPLDPFLDPNIYDRKPFYHYKSALISYYEATKRYYVSLSEGLEEKNL